MLNQIILVGRLTSDFEVIKDEEGNKRAVITIAVPRSFKNEEGVYETDFIKCKLFGVVAENTSNYCNKGDVIGIKGRLQTTINDAENGEKETIMEVIAEKVTFLSSTKSEEK